MNSRLPRYVVIGLLLGGMIWLGTAAERGAPAFQEIIHARGPLVVYFSGPGADSLTGERYWVERAGRSPERALALLLRGPGSPHLVSPIPAGTRLLDVQVRDGSAWVNFSGELLTGHPGGTAGELMTVYAVVNTLTEFASIRRVRIMVEGHPIQSLAGHLDLTEPLERDETLIAGVVTPPWQGSPPPETSGGPGRPGWPWWPPAALRDAATRGNTEEPRHIHRKMVGGRIMIDGYVRDRWSEGKAVRPQPGTMAGDGRGTHGAASGDE